MTVTLLSYIIRVFNNVRRLDIMIELVTNILIVSNYGVGSQRGDKNLIYHEITINY